MRLLLVVILFLAACSERSRDPFSEAVDLLSSRLGERVIVDHCPAASSVCSAHLASGASFEIAVERSPTRLNLRVVALASGRTAAAQLYKVFLRRGLELPDMQCPVLIPIGGDRPVACTGTVRGVPVVVMTTVDQRRFSFELTHGVISQAGLAQTIADTGLAGAGDADIDCNVDLRLSLPGSEIACGVAPRDGSPPRVVRVRIEDTDGHATVWDENTPPRRVD